VVAVSVRHTLRIVEHDPIWAWFVVRLALAHETLRSGLGRRLARDVVRGIERGRFVVEDLPTTLLAIGGAVLATLHGRLEGLAGADADAHVAGHVLRMLGLSRDEATAIVRRPLPPAPGVSTEEER
ncbi:MAG: TetR/AcrR family transcriptional regulator, partial [Chloroflexi bacterium]|nr:TetR/AcrR family transcriptional regulator [Chloroflexota bacterium]